LYFDASVYMLLVKDLLVTKRISEDVFYGANAGSTNHSGLEMMCGIRMNEYRLNSLPEVKMNLSFTVSDNRFKDFTDDGTNYTGKHLPGIPSYAFWGNLSFSFNKGFYLNYQYQNTGMQYLDDKNSQSYSGYQISSLKLGIRLKNISKLSSEIYLGVQNLFNEHYASMILVNAPSFGNALPRYYYPGQPRYIYGGIRISF
jgi:iron complex outermembrane receptor protein